MSVEMQSKLDEFELSVESDDVFDNQGVKIGEIVENELVLDESIFVEQRGVFVNQVVGFDTVEMSSWDKLALYKLGITPVSFEGVASITDGATVYLPMPEGAELVSDNPGVVQLKGGSLLINQFSKPKDADIFYGINTETNKAVVVVKDANEEWGQKKIIEYSEDTTLIIREYFGNTVWLALNEGEMRTDLTTTYVTDAQNLLTNVDYAKIEARKAGYVEKMSQVYGQDFVDWETMVDYLEQTPQGQKMLGNHSGGPGITMIDGVKKEYPEWHTSIKAFGLGFWKVDYKSRDADELVFLDFINPKMSEKMISMYVGYMKDGKFYNFAFMFDQTTKTTLTGLETLDNLTDGKTIVRYSFSLMSRIGLDVEDPKSIYQQYSSVHLNPGPLWDLVNSEVGLYFRLLSDAEVREHIFVFGLNPAEVMMIQQGIGGGNILVGQGIRITD